MTTASSQTRNRRAWIRASRWGALIVAFVVAVLAQGLATMGARYGSAATAPLYGIEAMLFVFGVAVVYVLWRILQAIEEQWA